jgi:hypothetical protein
MYITTGDHPGSMTTRDTRCDQTSMKKRCDISASKDGVAAMKRRITVVVMVGFKSVGPVRSCELALKVPEIVAP